MYINVYISVSQSLSFLTTIKAWPEENQLDDMQRGGGSDGVSQAKHNKRLPSIEGNEVTKNANIYQASLIKQHF